MKEYRVKFWVDGGCYTARYSATDLDDLKQMLKNSYNRFIIEEV